MNDIVHWLVSKEDEIAKFYKELASLFPDDKVFADFLLHLSEDEEQHCRLIAEADNCIRNKGGYSHSPRIVLDNHTKEKIELPLIKCKERLKEGSLTREDIIDCIVSVEFSEWNDMFLYVITSLKDCSTEFTPAIRKIQQHKRDIELFLESQPNSGGFLQRIKGLPAVWEKRILVVDDSEATITLIAAILADEGIVDCASGGEEALAKLGEKYFNAVITDVEMPRMDGITFYNEAAKKYPAIRERILFFTCSTDTELLSFFKNNKLKYLVKPVPINEIKKAVINLLSGYP